MRAHASSFPQGRPSDGSATDSEPPFARPQEFEPSPDALPAGCGEFRSNCILESLAEGVLITDDQGSIEFANAAACQAFGIPDRSLVGRALGEWVGPDQVPRILELDWVKNRLGQTARTIEIRGPNPQPRVLEATITLHRSENGTAGRLMTFRDVTSKRRAAEQLHLTTAALNAAANAIIITSADGTIQWVNPAFSRLTGYDENETLGKKPRFLKSGLHDDAYYADMWKTLLEGRIWHGEFVNQRKDGSHYHEDVTITPVRDAAGTIAHFIAVKTDITERKLAERRLRESEELNRSVMDGLQHGVFRKDLQGRYIYINRHFCLSTGMCEAEILGRTDEELFPAEIARKHREGDQQLLADRQSILFQGQYVDSAGQIVDIETHKFLIRDQHGVPFAVQGVFWDITDRIKAERDRSNMEVQLRHAQKMESIGQLAAGIAHEINTPTQYVGDNIRFFEEAFTNLAKACSEYGEVLASARQGSVPPEMLDRVEGDLQRLDIPYLLGELPTAIQQALHGVGRVASIVRAMKEFSHPGAEEKALVDLHHCIENTITVARNEWKYVAEVVTHFDPDLPRVPCVAGEFNQVVLNLIVNAAQAIAEVVDKDSSSKGRITIATRRDGDHVEVSVRDTGTGIAEVHRRRIFDPFFTTKPVGKGSGQGLAIVHSVIVDKHHGSVRFETELGQGTTFFVRLPLNDPPPTPTP
ncbi:MAG: PAS domain S-box protein [Verrucomicrobiales bacterium]|nr:PAS domain S-box protein [Verrucomicrobiales bacterium]